MDAVMRQDGRRPVAEVLQRTTQLADAIDFAASAGVHHGMLTPCDVFLEREWTGVTGFGLAQALIKVGIPAEAESRYGSPQRLAGAPPTRPDDIYSLAAITLELLVGTPADPDQDMSPALREAQGLPERRRLPRPAPHETRLFTSIAGVDAGKLRACFAAAFSEELSERRSTASDFVASFQDAISNKREMDEPSPSVVVVRSVSDERKDPPSAPVLETKPSDLVLATKPSDPVLETKRAEDEGLARPKPNEDIELFADEDVPPPRARSIDEPSFAIPAQSESRGLFLGVVIAVTFVVGFGGGFIVGQGSRPSTESNVSHHESVAAPQPARAAVEDSKPIASTTQTAAPIAEEKVTSPEPIAVPVAAQPAAAPVDESGRLLVRSTPAGAEVVVDGQSRGLTPLALRDLTFGAHTIAVSHAGHETRQQRVTLSERRPSRSIDFELRPTGVPSHDTVATNTTGSLQVASRPSGAQVFVDDNLIGTTPLLISDVSAGSKHLRIELSGYKAWTTSVQIEPSARVRVSAGLEP